MSTSVCRLCLAGNVELSHIHNTQILETYRKLTHAELNSADRPSGVCYICLSLLRRYSKFSEMARRSEQILTHIICRMGVEVTYCDAISALGVNTEHIIRLSIATIPSMTIDGYAVPHISDVVVKDEPLEVKQESSENVELIESTLEEVVTTAIILNEPNPSIINTDLINLYTNKCIIEPLQQIDTSSQNNEQKRYACTRCNKSFKKRNLLEDNLQIHTGKKAYQCNDCYNSFRGRSSLIAHLQIHTGEKPYKCKHCDISFNRKSTLVSHMHVHTGEKPHKCKHCDKSFSMNCNLTRHMLVHTGEKPYKCKHCDKSFSRNCYLTRHMTVHTGEKPYKCKHCDKSFSMNCDLIIHMRVHTGEKPHKCKHCDKSFSMNCNLTRHMLVHTGEKPYKCKHCNISFRQNSHLLRHNGKHHRTSNHT